MPDSLLRFLLLLDRHALWLLLLALLLVVLLNLWRWRLDSLRLASFSAAFHPQPPLPPSELVSLLVAAWNEQEHIERHIRSFLALRYPAKELILCAGGRDATFALANRWASENVIVLQQHPGEGKQAALRRCFARARGDVIFLTDADCFLDDLSFERTLQPVLQGAELVAAGASHPSDEQFKSLFVASQAVSQLYAHFRSPAYASGLLGRNCALRADLLRRSAALDQPAPTGTDYVLAKTLLHHGARIRRVPHSLVPTAYPSGLRSYIRQQRRWARSVFRFGWRFGAPQESRLALFNSLVGLGMLLLPFSFLFGLRWLAAFWCVLFFHALCSRLRYIALVRRCCALPWPPRLAFFQPLMLFIDFLAWARPLPDFFSPFASEAW